MITFLDLIKDTDFLKYVEKRLNSKETDISYSLTGVIPKLYRYRPFSKYAVDDIRLFFNNDKRFLEQF